jgi:hypothetical protein
MFKLRFRIEYIFILFLVVSMILSTIYTESLSCLPMKTVISSNSSNHTNDLFPRIGFADSEETNVENVPNRKAVLNVLLQTADSKQYSIDSSCNFSISPSNISASYPHQTSFLTNNI